MENDIPRVKTCPLCKGSATDLIKVDENLKKIIEGNNSGKDLPDVVCSPCYTSLTGKVSQGVKLRIEQQAKEKNRNMVWKSRVNLIKQARQMMTQKSYTDAAISYEKYLRVLEISYDLKKGQLTPDVFGKSSRSKELTVITTTYWDLFRIYDTNPQYRDRMRQAGRKLAEFLPYSPLYADIIKRSQEFVGASKNPDIVKEFLKLCRARSGKCFIATATYEDPFHPSVVEFRLYRDEVLLRTKLGRGFVSLYYFLSPPIARLIIALPILRAPMRRGLEKILQFLRTHLV